MSLLPFIIKNPQNGSLDSTKEKEVRMLYSPTDKKEFNNGRLHPNAKQEMGFHGLKVPLSRLDLSIKSITIGSRCSLPIRQEIEQICHSLNVPCFFKQHRLQIFSLYKLLQKR